MIDTDGRRDWLALAEQAARAGAEALAHAAKHGRVVEREEGRETKIVADVKAEDAIVSVLQAGSPFPILSEEAGDLGGALATVGFRWIVDPLDGSLNYSRDIPLSVVSVALWDRDDAVLGVLIDPARQDVYTGLVGDGACLNGAPVSVSRIDAMKDAVLCTGFPVGADFSTEALMGVVQRVQGFKKVRMLGSAALSLAYVACGRAEVYREDEIKLWDVAAGIAIVLSAGGTVRIKPGHQPLTRKVTAGNGRFAT